VTLRRAVHTIAACAVAALFCWCAGFFYFFMHVSAYHSLPDDRAEAIVVLTGGPQRVNAGFDLLANHHSEKLLITGVNRKVTTETLLNLWKSGKYGPNDEPFVTAGVTIDRQARNTVENAREASVWVRDNDIKWICLVTADYHMPRALMEFRHAMPDLRISPYAIKSPHWRWLFAFAEYNKNLWRWTDFKLTDYGLRQ
jgi:uncharacterized SAM-binding protein YcdF (DUF218 family)